MDPLLVGIGYRLRNSDGTACTELFRLLHEPLLRYAARLLRNGDQAYDVVQDAFLSVWQHRQQIDPERSLRAYLFRTVRNGALNRMGRDRVMESTDDVDQLAPDACPDEDLVAEELGAQIHAWIEALPPRRREAFQLSRFEGLSHDEIADVMGLTPRTVTSHVMLALQDLRDRLRVYEAE